MQSPLTLYLKSLQVPDQDLSKQRRCIDGRAAAQRTTPQLAAAGFGQALGHVYFGDEARFAGHKRMKSAQISPTKYKAARLAQAMASAAGAKTTSIDGMVSPAI
jgi:hypothetical protein